MIPRVNSLAVHKLLGVNSFICHHTKCVTRHRSSTSRQRNINKRLYTVSQKNVPLCRSL